MSSHKWPGAFQITMKPQSLRFYVGSIYRKYITPDTIDLDKAEGDQKMNLHFTFSIREISEVRDSEQVLRIPMYFTVTWEVCKEGFQK